MAALDYLKARGLTARKSGNRVSVTPRNRITEIDRQWIRLHRMELLAELAANDGHERRTHWTITAQGRRFTMVGICTYEEALDHARGIWPDAEVSGGPALE